MQEAKTQLPETFPSREGLTRAESRTRLGAALAVLILYAVGVLALGSPPSASATGEQVVTWFRQNREDARWAVWAATVSILPFAIMFALLRLLLPAPHRDVFSWARSCS